jgi:putative inorganic carbon (hco3(-)) transporter
MQSAGNPSPALVNTPVDTASWQGQWLGLAGFFALLSFTWLPNSYSLMVGWPYCLWWQGAFCLLIGWSVWMSRQFALPFRPLGYGLDWAIFIVICGSGLSALTAEFRLVAGWNLLLLMSYGIVLYVAVNWLRQCAKSREQLWLSIVVVGTVTHIISLACWRPNWQMWTSGDFYSAVRNPLPLGHHNFVGGYCLLMLPLIVGFSCTQTGKKRWLGYGAIALNAIALYASGSRGALLGALALGLLIFCLYCLYHSAKTLKQWLLMGLLAFVIVLALFSNPRVRSLASFNPSASKAAFSIEQIGDGPTQDRLFMLQAGQRIFKTHPLLGVGSGNLARLYNLYRPVEAGGGLELVQQLHNTPAQILAELGLIGIGGYLLWFGCWLKIGIALHRKVLERCDRILLYSIGASWFAYGISSLTDYQLENIGIASTLLLTTVLLVNLADNYSQVAPIKAMSNRARRIVSLGLLLYLSIVFQAWARVTAGFYLATSAQQDIEVGHIVDADAKLMKASHLVPWDPTYAALSAEQLLDLKEFTSDPKNKDTLTSTAITSLESALKAAPNDPWFNQNLAVLLLENDPQRAEHYIRHTALLSPRSLHTTYYTLGCIYLKQKKYSQATTAFVLEGLANPAFLVDPIWKNPPFSEQRSPVVDQTLAAWQQILSITAAGSTQYNWLNQQIALIQWWYRKPLSTDKQANLSTFLQAVLSVDESSTRALSLLNQEIPNSVSEEDVKLALLRAWINPDQYLADFLTDFDGTEEEKQTVTHNIHAFRDLREWLTSVNYPTAARLRFGLAFAYRNQSANSIRTILAADGLSSSPLLDQFALFSPPPREFTQLDQKISEISAQDLALHQQYSSISLITSISHE